MIRVSSTFGRRVAARWRAGFNVDGWPALALALGGAGAGVLLWWLLEPLTNPDRHFIALVPSTIVVTLAAGARLGILSAAISGIAVWFFFLPPEGSVYLSQADTVALSTYVISTAVAIGLVYWLRSTQARERLLLHEVQHRTKNLFAIVHGLALQTLRGDATVPQARDTFLSRLHALDRSTERIRGQGWGSVNLGDLVCLALEPYSGRFEWRGPDVRLSSRTAQNFSLALHELATNAAKYGGLSTQEGRIRIDWRRCGHGRSVTFVWQERGGPRVIRPERTGFGTKLLQTLFGTGEIEFAPEGIIYRVTIPESVIANR